MHVEIPQWVWDKLTELKAKRLYIQVPEGLRTEIQKIVDILREKGYDSVIHAEPTFGACDVPEHNAKLFGCDVLLHIGHEDFGVKVEMPVIYWPFIVEVDPIPALEKFHDKLPQRLGIVTMVNHRPTLETVVSYLQNKGKTVENLGTILGCRHGKALPAEKKVDAYVFIGSGKFHPLGLAKKTEKPVYLLDLERQELRSMDADRKRVLMLRAAGIAALKDAHTVAILLTAKKGQLQMHMDPFKVKEKLESIGKKVYMLSMDYVSDEKTLGMKIDVFVNCACPRLVEDQGTFRKPLVNPEDLLELFKPVATVPRVQVTKN